MTLLKRTSSFPSLLSDFFEREPFFNNDWVGDRWLSEIPKVNIEEKDGEYDIEVAAPGMNKNDFHITCEEGLLTIKAEREKEEKKEAKNYTRREYDYSSFSRTFSLPESVRNEEVKAKYENGVLRVVVPKKVTAKKPVKEIKIG